MSNLWLLPFTDAEADTSRLRPVLPSAFSSFFPRVTRDGRLIAFGSNESGKLLTYVAALRADGGAGTPIEVPTQGTLGHQWSADGRTLYVEDELHHMMRIGVSSSPELSLSAPVPVHDFDKLGVGMWTLLPDGRFFVGLKSEAEREITRYNLVLNWTDELKRRMRQAR